MAFGSGKIVKEALWDVVVKIDKFIVIGVNYDSYLYAENFVVKWVERESVQNVILVDNFSSERERIAIRALGTIARVTVLESANRGYGCALNLALKYVDENCDCTQSVILFGNVDVEPDVLVPVSVKPASLPEVAVIEGSRDRNPFLTQLQKRLIGLYGHAAKTHSRTLLRMCLALNKAFAIVPSRTWAVHGALFAIPGTLISGFRDVFSPDVFLYCEELFFARKVEALGLHFQRCGISVRHVGGVSTGSTLRANSDRFFENWCRSMRAYINS